MRPNPKTVAALVACLAFVALAHAAQPCDEVEMEVPLERRVTNIAEYDGIVTLASERVVGLYHRVMHGPPDEALRRACGELPFEERVRCAECFPFTLYENQMEIIQSGEVTPRLMRRVDRLYEPGHSREAWRAEAEELLEADYDDGFFEHQRRAMEPYVGIRLQERFVWDGYTFIGAIGVKNNDRSGPWFTNLTYVHDGEEDRYYMVHASMRPSPPKIPLGVWQDTARILDFEGHPSQFHPVIDVPPPNARILRYTLDTPDGPERPSRYVEELESSDGIEFDDMILYVKDEAYPADARAFLDIDPASLDDAGRELQDALATRLLWFSERDDPGRYIDELVSDWHPSLQEHYTEEYNSDLRQWNERRDSGGDPPMNSLYLRNKPIVNMVTDSDIIRGGDFLRVTPRMRIASRIRTDNAIIWYGWAHREESPSAEDAYLIRYIQLRTPDGDYKLIESDYSDALQESDYLRDKYAIDALPYKLYRILTRHQREAQLGGE